MHVSNKEEILKLLNFDTMINQYLKQPKLNRKTPATNNKPKPNPHSSNANITSTLDVNLNNKRNLSTHQFTRSTLDTNKSKINPSHRSIFKVQSCRNNKLNEWLIPQPSIPHSRKMNSYSKLLKTEKTLQTHQLNEYTESIAKNTAKKRKFENESTNLLENEDSFTEKTPPKMQASSEGRNKIKARLNNLQPKVSRVGCILKGRYQLQKIIGRGLSGQVYKAKDILSERYVAIKLIQPTNVEYQFIKQLQHPNMISYYNSFIENDKRCIVLEYLPHSLAEVARKRKLTEEEVKRAFRAISSGLMYLHSLSYAHRDIKPDNLVTNEDFSLVKFIDFGLCVDTGESDAKQFKRICGTTSYMAPEVICGRCLEPKKADIWSLGVVLYLLYVGRNPFTARQDADIFNKIKNNKTVFPSEMPEPLKNLLSQMLKKNADERPTIIQIVTNNWVTG